MSAPVILASCLVVAGLVLGLLPAHYRRAPALPLLALAPGVVLWIAAAHGIEIGLLWTVALAALYRAPLGYWMRRGVLNGRRNGAGQTG